MSFRMRHLLFVAVVALCACSVLAQSPDTPSPGAAAIMARVAANQDRAEAERAHSIYVQHVHVISRSGKTVRCQETTDTRITPTPTGSSRQLLKLDGRVLIKHSYVAYTQPVSRVYVKPVPAQTGGPPAASKPDGDMADDSHASFDRDLVEDLRNDLTGNNTKDGIGKGLFPLTSKMQADYTFHLIGREHMNGRDVFHLTFSPKDPHDYGWKGDAYVDSEAFQPVVVRTVASRNLPFAVRGLLGTNIPGLGFTVIYAPQPGGIWFPVSFGTEFKLHVLFFYSRQISLSLVNSGFEQTHVNSRIVPVQSAQGMKP